MECHDAHHLKTCCTPYSATLDDLYRLEQDVGEPLRHYIWRFRGVDDYELVNPKRKVMM